MKILQRPYEKGYVRVSGGHRLYYERCGKRGGVPAIFLHGGPGTGFVEKHKALFDFKTFDVLFFDQRGAGRSKPYGSLHKNTTWHLVDDITFLLDKFRIEKAVVYGGSWGSTLALAYAITHPERVAGLVLRGIYLSNQDGEDWYLKGGVEAFAPEAWERFVSLVPPGQRGRVADYYRRQMASKNRAVRRKFCYEWSRYEMSLVALKAPDETQLSEMMTEYSFESLAILESHYIARNGFFPPNFILKNAGKLAGMPVAIVHGRYDLICRPVEAWQLHKKIPGSRLHFVVGGHAASEPAVKRMLRAEIKRVAREAGL
ncbi:MAG: prolyl aminopeptidase [Elusimicrobia bacterium]|nr:prolyl aminopeptidase [Elusimicrobiota bacterium]